MALVPLSIPSANAQPSNRTLYGKVYSETTGQPITATVTVTRCGDAQTVTTSSDGSWQLSYPYGAFATITFSAAGYQSETFQMGQTVGWYASGGILSLQPV
ncbi:MAG TPA: hypothetical protein VLV18_07255 [Terriglobales bacterium]|nr:hypothetical protein [Terriglobales bacterium]